MNITPEESEAYRWMYGAYVGSWDFICILRDALRRHVAAEMEWEFLAEHNHERRNERLFCEDPRHKYEIADWNQAADTALKGERG